MLLCSSVAHKALADLEALGKLRAIVTQNIDNLHQGKEDNIIIISLLLSSYPFNQLYITLSIHPPLLLLLFQQLMELAHSFPNYILSIIYNNHPSDSDYKSSYPTIAAGNKKVFELHGNASTHSCISCKKSHSHEHIHSSLISKSIPRCTSCSELVKTDVILFGENLPRATIEGAMEEAQGCDLLIVVGSR